MLMAMPRVVVFGEGPLPVERLPMSGSARRGWRFVQALLAAGHEVCFVATRPAAVYPPDLPPVLTQSKDRLAYYSIAAGTTAAALDPLVPGYGGACVLSITTPAAALADGVVGYLPHWADLYGGLPIADEAAMTSRALHADVFSCGDEEQRRAVLAALTARGRLDERTAGYDFARIIPLAEGDGARATDGAMPTPEDEGDAAAFAALAAEMLAWASFPLHAPDWVAPAVIPGPPAPVAPPPSFSHRAARMLWRLSRRASAAVGLAPAHDRLAAALKARWRQQ
jgi:hypothetical protein